MPYLDLYDTLLINPDPILFVDGLHHKKEKGNF